MNHPVFAVLTCEEQKQKVAALIILFKNRALTKCPSEVDSSVEVSYETALLIAKKAGGYI
jgi:hypothetical protein